MALLPGWFGFEAHFAGSDCSPQSLELVQLCGKRTCDTTFPVTWQWSSPPQSP